MVQDLALIHKLYWRRFYLEATQGARDLRAKLEFKVGCPIAADRGQRVKEEQT